MRRLHRGEGGGGCLSPSRARLTIADCKARNDAGNQIWAGSNLTARELRGGGKEAVVPRHITESMITAKTSTYLVVFLRSICFSPPLLYPFPHSSAPHHLSSSSPSPFSSPLVIRRIRADNRDAAFVHHRRRARAGAGGRGRGRDETANVIDEVDLCLI